MKLKAFFPLIGILCCAGGLYAWYYPGQKNKNRPNDLSEFSFKGPVHTITTWRSYHLSEQWGAEPAGDTTSNMVRTITFNRQGNMDSFSSVSHVLHYHIGSYSLFSYGPVREDRSWHMYDTTGAPVGNGKRLWLNNRSYKDITSDVTGRMISEEINELDEQNRLLKHTEKIFEKDSVARIIVTNRYIRATDGNTKMIIEQEMHTGKTDTFYVEILQQDHYGNPTQSQMRKKGKIVSTARSAFSYY